MNRNELFNKIWLSNRKKQFLIVGKLGIEWTNIESIRKDWKSIELNDRRPEVIDISRLSHGIVDWWGKDHFWKERDSHGQWKLAAGRRSHVLMGKCLSWDSFWWLFDVHLMFISCPIRSNHVQLSTNTFFMFFFQLFLQI